MGRIASASASPASTRSCWSRTRRRLMPDLTRRLFIARRRQPRRADAAHRLRRRRRFLGRRDAEAGVEIQRRRAGAGSSIRTRWRRPSRKARSQAVPVQRLLRLDERPRSTASDWKLEVRGLVENKKPWTLDELYALPQVKQVTRHICVEGWSAIGSWTGTPLARFPQAASAPTRAPNMSGSSAPTRTATIAARHGDRAASADPDDVQVRRRDPAARLRLSDEDPRADKTRLQEPEVRDRRWTSPTTTPAATGKTRATIRSAAAERARGISWPHAACEAGISPSPSRHRRQFPSSVVDGAERR